MIKYFKFKVFCIGSVDYRGCESEGTCVPKDRDNTGELCPGICPIECKKDEVLCIGQEDSNGCKLDDECKTKVKDINRDYCPENSASHGCPKTCDDDEILCPPKTDPLGCMEEAKCTPRTIDNHGNVCPEESECPLNCPPGTVSCPGGFDENGCPRPNVCDAQERNLDGELCAVHCTNVPTCSEDELFCPGSRDEYGCTERHQCIKRPVKTKGSDKGGLCPGSCPIKCDIHHDEILCPSHEDPCDGCPIEETCRIAAKDENGIFCSGRNYPNEYFSASHGCPKPCEEIDGYVLCPATHMANGCHLESLCMPRQMDFMGEYCPRDSTCPQYCKSNEIRCEYGLDKRGCNEAPICVERGIDKDGFQCPGFCPPSCNGDTALQKGGKSGNGCLLPSTCQGKLISVYHTNLNFIDYKKNKKNVRRE